MRIWCDRFQRGDVTSVPTRHLPASRTSRETNSVTTALRYLFEFHTTRRESKSELSQRGPAALHGMNSKGLAFFIGLEKIKLGQVDQACRRDGGEPSGKQPAATKHWRVSPGPQARQMWEEVACRIPGSTLGMGISTYSIPPSISLSQCARRDIMLMTSCMQTPVARRRRGSAIDETQRN